MSSRLLIAAFLLALAAPWFDLCVRPAELRDPSGYENRSIAAFPQLAWNAALLNQFPPRFERYFADRLGTRDLLLRTHSIQSLEWLGVHPANNMYLGREDWWFYSGDQALELLRTGSRLDPQELETWAASLARIARWCEAQGIPFAVAFGPNKETIYADYLPAHLSDCRSARLDQLMPELKARGVRCIDLRPALRAAREGDTPGDWLYHRLGTHWTDRGGLIAAQAVLAALSADLPGCGTLNEADYERVPAQDEEDSLAARSYLGARHRQHPWKRILRGGFRAQAESLETLPYPITERRDPARTERPRVLMVHDSFGAPLDKYLAEALGSLVQTHRYALDRDLVARFKPDVILAVYVERHLGGAPFTLVGGYSPEERDALFERSTTVLHRWAGGSADFSVQRRAHLDFRAGALEIRTTTPADTLLLPVMPYPAEGGALLRLELESGQAQVFDLFYLRPGYEDYDRSANIELPIESGSNRVTVVLDQPGLHGRLCLRARVPGRWMLRSLELRAPPP